MKLFREYCYEMILIVISFFLLALLIAPYWFGYKMQTNYENVLKSLSNNTDYSYEVISFRRGWFSTDADLLVKNSSNEALFYLNHQIIHGPVYLGLLLEGKSPIVSMVIKGDVISAANTDNVFFKLFQDTKRIGIHAVIHSNTDAVLTLNVPDVNKNVGAMKYELEDIAFKLKYFSDSNQYQGELSSKKIKLVGASVFDISNLILSFDQVINNDNLDGDLVLSFSSLKTKLAEQMLDIKQLSLRLRNKKISNLLGLDIDTNASVINIFNEQINGLSLGMKMSGVEYSYLKDKVFGMFADNADKKSSAPYDYIFFSTLNIETFDFITEHGSFSSKLTLTQNPEASDEEDRYFMNVKPSLDLIVGDTLFKRIYEIVVNKYNFNAEKANKFIHSMLKVNYLEKNSNKYQLRLSNKEEKLMVNDLLINHDDLKNNLSSAFFLR